MNFNLGKKLEAFRDSSLSAVAASGGSRKKLIITIVIVLIALFAIVNTILLGFVGNKAKALHQDKEAMAESLSKISAVLNKAPTKTISKTAFMARNTLSGHTGTILSQINDIISQKDTMVASLQNAAETVHYSPLNFSDTNDMNVIQSRLRGLAGHLKKLFDLNEKLSAFVLKAASLTDQSVTNQNELNEKLSTSPENVYLPILENIEKNKKSVGSLQQEINANTNTIAELKKAIEGAGTNKNELQQMLQQKQNELTKVKNEYSKLKDQIKSVVSQPSVKKTTDVTAVAAVKKSPSPELYHKLKGEVVEYNSKWGFIIINFGSDSKLYLDIENEVKEINAPVPLDKEVYIARGDKFVAKAKIVSVYSKYSVANIIFPVAEEVKKGDSVFFDQPKSN